MGKNDFCFGVVSPKNAPSPPVPRIGPGVIFFGFQYSLFAGLT